MSKTQPENGIKNPQGRAIAVMDSLEQGEAAKKALIGIEISADEIEILNGSDQAQAIDTSAKWFADTDEFLERYQKKLAAGATLVSAPVDDNSQLKKIQEIYRTAGAETMTNFGALITRTIDLDHPEKEEAIG